MVELLTINIDDIEVGERFRKDYGDLQGLAHSIKERGQITPIAVKRSANGKPFLLLAGGRRISALRLNETPNVLVRVYEEDISELELRSIELAENFWHKPMDFREHTALTAEIHRLQQEIMGVKISTSPDASGWSMRDTAEMLNTSQATISRDIQMANLMAINPELFSKCKTKTEAAGVVRKLSKALETTQVAKRLAKLPLETKKRELMDAYMIGDFFEKAKQLPSECVNLIEVDPPYGVDLTMKADINPNTDYSGYNEVSKEDYPKFLRKLANECYRLLMPNSWLIFWFAQQPWQEVVYNELTGAGFKLTRIYCAWIKPSGNTHRPLQQLANGIECFYYAAKGNATIQTPGHLNYFLYNSPSPNEKTHSTERPLELMKEVLKIFGKPNDRLLVPFAGSGNTLLAGYSLGMHPFGYDLTQVYRDSYLIKVNKLI
jgi:DNA modification methylase